MRVILPTYLGTEREPRLPAGLDIVWYADRAGALAALEEAEIAWIDMPSAEMNRVMRRSGKLKWAFTLGAGVECFDMAALAETGAVLVNGSGLTSVAVAEYAVLGILAAAKRYDEVVRLTDRHQWTDIAPGRIELAGTHALIVGMGMIGRAVAKRLTGLDVEVTGVTRLGREGMLAADQWRARLGDFDWVVLAPPTTRETRMMIGAAELAAMRPTAWLVNVGRGELVDQAALIEALRQRRIGGAFLDVTTPEPLPPDHPLWGLENCLLGLHLAGRSQSSLIARAWRRFAENLAAYLAGRPMTNVVDLTIGY